MRGLGIIFSVPYAQRSAAYPASHYITSHALHPFSLPLLYGPSTNFRIPLSQTFCARHCMHIPCFTFSIFTFCCIPCTCIAIRLQPSFANGTPIAWPTCIGQRQYCIAFPLFHVHAPSCFSPEEHSTVSVSIGIPFAQHSSVYIHLHLHSPSCIA